jgi:hypothetical protein
MPPASTRLTHSRRTPLFPCHRPPGGSSFPLGGAHRPLYYLPSSSHNFISSPSSSLLRSSFNRGPTSSFARSRRHLLTVHPTAGVRIYAAVAWHAATGLRPPLSLPDPRLPTPPVARSADAMAAELPPAGVGMCHRPGTPRRADMVVGALGFALALPVDQRQLSLCLVSGLMRVVRAPRGG